MNQAQLHTLICPICLEYSQEAVSSSCCKTIYCRDCAQALANNCSMCRAVCHFDDNILAKRLIDMIEVTCDCGYKCARGNLEVHKINSCIKTLVKCPFEDCNKRIQKDECYQHVQLSHSDRLHKPSLAQQVLKKTSKKETYRYVFIPIYILIISL